MKMFFGVISVVISLVALTISCAPGAKQVGQWERCELTFRGETGRNPFIDVTLGAVFSGPNGETISVDGFYAGDGEGGQDGDIFKIRFSPPSTGEWTYSIYSSISDVDGTSGKIKCVESGRKGTAGL